MGFRVRVRAGQIDFDNRTSKLLSLFVLLCVTQRLTNCVQVLQIIGDIVLPSLTYSWATTTVAVLDPVAECLLALTFGCMTVSLPIVWLV